MTSAFGTICIGGKNVSSSSFDLREQLQDYLVYSDFSRQEASSLSQEPQLSQIETNMECPLPQRSPARQFNFNPKDYAPKDYSAMSSPMSDSSSFDSHHMSRSSISDESIFSEDGQPPEDIKQTDKKLKDSTTSTTDTTNTTNTTNKAISNTNTTTDKSPEVDEFGLSLDFEDWESLFDEIELDEKGDSNIVCKIDDVVTILGINQGTEYRASSISRDKRHKTLSYIHV